MPGLALVKDRLQRYRRISLAVECCPLAADTVYLVREAQSGLVLTAGWATQVNLGSVVRRSRQIGKEIVGVVSAPDEGICRTVAQVFPGIPHQFCQDALFDTLMEGLRPGGAAWPFDAVHSVADILRRGGRGEDVAALVEDRLLHMQEVAETKPECRFALIRSVKTVRAWWRGLFHCYDLPQLPATCSRWRSTWEALRKVPGAGRDWSLGCEDILRQAWETRALPTGTLRLLDELAARQSFTI
jgi:hypothetical protein